MHEDLRVPLNDLWKNRNDSANTSGRDKGYQRLNRFFFFYLYNDSRNEGSCKINRSANLNSVSTS